MSDRTHFALSICTTLTILSLILLTSVSYAVEATNCTPKITHVALFKNGLGYFTSSVILPKGAEEIRIGSFPAPSHGTFWIEYPKDEKITSLRTTKDEVKTETCVNGIPELLAENIGKRVELRTSFDDLPAVAGTIQDVLPEKNEPVKESNPYFMSFAPENPRGYHYPVTTPPQFVLIRTYDGIVTLPVNSIVYASFPQVDINTKAVRTDTQPAIYIDMSEPSKGEEVTFNYLAHGITWSPSYLVVP